MRTCSYYVQQLYACNKGTEVLPLTMNGRPVAGKEGQNQLYASVVKDSGKNEYIVKVANLSSDQQEISICFTRLPRRLKLAPEVCCTTLHSDNLNGENTIEDPDQIAPVRSLITDGLKDNTLTAVIGPKTFAVYKLTYSE